MEGLTDYKTEQIYLINTITHNAIFNMKKQIDPVVKDVLNELTKAYTESEGKTKAGRFFRFALRFVPIGTILNALVHKK